MTGFMGSGKSAVSPHVANMLGFDSVDLDRMITDAESMSVPAIFDVLGEDAFRKAERQALHATAGMEGVVVSLGGGTIMNPENLAFCRGHGVLIGLRAPVDVLCRRLSRRAGTRPLLLDERGRMLTGPALRERVVSLLATRSPVYEQADILIDTGDRHAKEVAIDVVRAFDGWPG